jgi:hypothetical protein
VIEVCGSRLPQHALPRREHGWANGRNGASRCRLSRSIRWTQRTKNLIPKLHWRLALVRRCQRWSRAALDLRSQLVLDPRCPRKCRERRGVDAVVVLEKYMISMAPSRATSRSTTHEFRTCDQSEDCGDARHHHSAHYSRPRRRRARVPLACLHGRCCTCSLPKVARIARCAAPSFCGRR